MKTTGTLHCEHQKAGQAVVMTCALCANDPEGAQIEFDRDRRTRAKSDVEVGYSYQLQYWDNPLNDKYESKWITTKRDSIPDRLVKQRDEYNTSVSRTARWRVVKVTETVKTEVL